MRVKCKKIINSVTDQLESRSNWLTIGKIYVVLSISIPLGKNANFILISDDNSTPLPFNVDQFEVICDKIPSVWSASLNETNELNFAPSDWLQSHFWEDYFNFEQDAVSTYNKEVNKILQESM